MNVWLWIRALCGVFAVGLALHLLVLVDTQLGWKLTLAAGEYGHRVAVIALLFAVPGLLSPGCLARTGTVTLLVSSAVLCWPLLQGMMLAKSLPSELEAAFGKPKGRGEAPSFRGAWLGGKPPPRVPETFVYANDVDGERSLRVFRAVGHPHAPCVLVIHGGGWENGNPSEFPEWNAHWSARGYAVASIEYRLAPKHRWPAPREDVRRGWE
jgi:acetyl esterase/lipase